MRVPSSKTSRRGPGGPPPEPERVCWLDVPRLVLVLLTACDASVVTTDAAPSDAGSDGAWDPIDAAPSDGGPVGGDAGPPAEPVPYAPCEAGDCWDAAATFVRCGSFAGDEDFSSGTYNVHAYATTLWAGAETTLTLERRTGDWQPALIVTERDGTVLYDGTTGRVRAGLTVEGLDDGTTGSVGSVRISVDADLPVTVHVSAWSVLETSFGARLPLDATYRLTVASECAGVVTVPCIVNGNLVDEPACGWLHHLAREVVPRLDGTRDERLTVAARVGWWSLKEGVLFLPNPIVFSNCNFTTGDRRIGPLEVCPSGRAWQVGLAAAQVPGPTLPELEAIALRQLPGSTVDEILARTALEAGLDPATADAVVASTGDLRRSWLLRTSSVGVTREEWLVTPQCVTGSAGWCYGTAWTSTRLYAPDAASVPGAISDVRAILDAVAP